MPEPIASSVDHILSNPAAQQQAFEGSRAQRDAIGLEDLRRANLAFLPVARLLLSKNDGIQALRPQIVEELPKHPIELHDNLVSYLLAALHAHYGYRLLFADPEVFDALMEEAVPLRKLLLDWADPGIQWGAFKKEEIKVILAGRGNLDKAQDCSDLGHLYVSRWHQLEGKVDVSRQQAERAIVLGQELLRALGTRGQSPEGKKAALDYHKAFTVLSKAYDEVIAAVSYVRRHEGDADDIAPSLFSTRRKVRRKADGQGTFVSGAMD